MSIFSNKLQKKFFTWEIGYVFNPAYYGQSDKGEPFWNNTYEYAILSSEYQTLTKS